MQGEVRGQVVSRQGVAGNQLSLVSRRSAAKDSAGRNKIGRRPRRPASSQMGGRLGRVRTRSTADKLGIKLGLRISAFNMPGDKVMQDARKQAAEFSADKPLPGSDMIFMGVDSEAELSRIRKLISVLASNGAFWLI